MPIGKLDPFDLSSKQWPAYIRRVKQYILLNEIKDDVKVALLITVVGEATYALMCDLCSPDNPEDKTFDELVTLVSDHLEPQRSEIAERHVFRLRRQRPGEPLSEYLHSLKHLASTCNFGASLEENLRDQFVSGLTSEAMRSRIFAEKQIKYKEAVELALALEAAERHAEVSGAVMTGAGTSASTGGAGEGLHQASVRRRQARWPPAAPRPVGGGGGSRGSQAHTCWRCGKAHRAEKCRYVNYNCDECNQRGHLKVMCKARKGNNWQNYLSEESETWQNGASEESEDDFFNINIMAQGNKPYFVELEIDGHGIKCEIDTGSRISAISEELFKRMFSHKTIRSDNLILRCYSGLKIESLGYVMVDIALNGVTARNMPLYVIKNGSRPLLGRDWMRALKIKQINFNEINMDNPVNLLRGEFSEVFSDKLGTCKRVIRLQLTDDDPVYIRARPVPLALKDRVEQELLRLERDGTIYRVDQSEYGTPIVPVVKENGHIRICGDYKITINPKLKRDFYPLPRIDELFANLSGGEKYTKIDLKHAFEQCLLSEDSQACTAITTHVGTFAYRRTPYGLSCIPEKFQKIMEETLRGLEGVVCFQDDIAVTGADHQQHMRNLRAVLVRLRDTGLTVKLSKCKFLQDRVKYLGFIIDREGLRPDPAKLEAISNAPQPQDVSQLKSFLGMLNYYGKFIPNLSVILHPLHALLKKDTSWKWDSGCQKAFSDAKRELLSDRVLAHYSEGRPLVLAVDSSSYGIGGVLSHRYPDGSERPISCVSRTLNQAETNYSQLGKEALAILFGVTKHHQYLYGRKFLLKTDHKPLSYIFGKKMGIPQTAASRLQRWAARLAAYDFSVEFIKSAENGPADALSRLPLPGERRPTEVANYLLVIEESMPVNFKDVAKETQRDPLLSKIYGYILFGWPSDTSSNEEKPYFARKQELFVDLGCIIYKYRIVIPPHLRNQVLEEIHEGHLGMNKMKNLSRNYVYWPSLDSEIENICRTCGACRATRDSPPHAPLHPWEFPLHSWQRLHADFGEYAGRKFLILVDAHSKWIEAMEMRSTEATSTINAFRVIFARFGFPSQLVTDNGPPFFSTAFKQFCSNNCIKHVTSAPYRPQGNGAAENAVKTIKKAIKKAIFDGENVTAALNKFLFQYRNCEHASTGVSPARALLGRQLRGRLDALRPDATERARALQEKQAAAASSAGSTRELSLGDTVLARDYTARKEKWAVGTVTERTGPVSYKVDVGREKWRRHIDQLVRANKNRHSLTRMSVDPVGDGVDDTFEDASAGEESESSERAQAVPIKQPSPGAAAPEASGVRGATSSEHDIASTLSVSSPPPDASARALRAYNRAVKALEKNNVNTKK